jgi:hypothetical protein
LAVTIITGVPAGGTGTTTTIMETHLTEIWSKDVYSFVNMIQIATRTRFLKQVKPSSGANSTHVGMSRASNCRNIAISLIDPDFGEQTGQACAND